MNSYTDFAYIYDSLMHKDIDYEKWADYIENLFIMYDIKPPDLVCDLCMRYRQYNNTSCKTRIRYDRR